MIVGRQGIADTGLDRTRLDVPVLGAGQRRQDAVAVVDIRHVLYKQAEILRVAFGVIQGRGDIPEIEADAARDIGGAEKLLFKTGTGRRSR